MHPLTFYTAFVIALSFFGESIFGFGSGLIAVPLLSLLLGVREAVTLILIFQFCMGLLLWNVREQIDWDIAHVMTPSVIIGSIGGTLLLSSVPAVALQLFLMLFILGFLVKSAWFDRTHSGTMRNKSHMIVAGFSGGIFQGLIGTGGTVFIIFLSRFGLPKAKLRATLIYLLFLTSVVRLLISTQERLFTPDIIHAALVALPLFLIAILAGHNIHHRLNERYYRLSINIILLLSAFALLVKLLWR